VVDDATAEKYGGGGAEGSEHRQEGPQFIEIEASKFLEL